MRVGNPLKRQFMLLLTAGALLSGETVFAQSARVPPAAWTVRQDTVYFWLTRTPGRNWGFKVYRKEASEPSFRLLTESPVRAVRGPAELRRVLGSGYTRIADLLDADDAGQVLRRLRSDAFRGGVLGLLDHRVARALGRFYADTTASGTGPFTYRFVFVDRVGREGERFEISVTKRAVLPVAPSSLRAEAGDGRVTLHWSYPKWAGEPSDLAVHFQVLRKMPGQRDFVVANSRILLREQKDEFSFTDLWLKNGLRYTYAVVAVDPLGRRGPESNLVQVMPVDRVPPAPPSGLVALADTAKVRLSWALSPELDVAGYKVYRALSPRDEARPISEMLPADQPFFVDRSAEKGMTLFYRVSAIDSAGNESPLSNAVSARVSDAEPPQAPQQINAKAGPEGLRVSWRPSPSRDLAGYHVFWGTDTLRMGRATRELLGADAKEFLADAKILTPGRGIWVSVVAVDRAGNMSDSRPVWVEVPDWKAPSPPSGFAVRLQNGRKANLVWGASPSLDVRHYRVYRVTADSGAQLLAELGPEARRFIDEGLTKGQQVTYRVSAVDATGNESTPVEKTLVVRDRVPPPAPRDLAAHKVEGGVEITWGRVIASDLAGFYVYRSDLPTGVFERLNKRPLKERRYVDPEGTRAHWYKVRAVDTSGNESPWKRPVRPQ